MKPLEKEFVANVDKSGDNIFRQVRRSASVAIYERLTMDNRWRAFEIFVIKLVKAGAKLPAGMVVEEDYESYPTKNAFGKRAWYITGVSGREACLRYANKRFDELETAANSIVDDEEEANEQPAVAVVDVQPESVPPTEIQIPSGKFTHAELAEFNHKTRQQVYVQLQQLVKLGVLRAAGTRAPAGGKGKASNLFEKA